MKVLGKRQKKDRARVVRARVVEPFEIEYPALMAAAAGVGFHGSDGGPCDCWGDSVRWVALPFTREQFFYQGADPSLIRPPSSIPPFNIRVDSGCWPSRSLCTVPCPGMVYPWGYFLLRWQLQCGYSGRLL